MNNPQTLPPPDAEGDGIYQKLARCSSVGEIKRMLEGNGMVIKTAAERDRLKASNKALVEALEAAEYDLAQGIFCSEEMCPHTDCNLAKIRAVLAKASPQQ